MYSPSGILRGALEDGGESGDHEFCAVDCWRAQQAAGRAMVCCAIMIRVYLDAFFHCKAQLVAFDVELTMEERRRRYGKRVLRISKTVEFPRPQSILPIPSKSTSRCFDISVCASTVGTRGCGKWDGGR